MTIEDLATNLSDTGRDEVTEALRGLGIDPDKKLFVSEAGSDSVFSPDLISVKDIEMDNEKIGVVSEDGDEGVVIAL